ncbi:hypothetical protein [Candidatus Methanoperedens nitratireducens]|nr:hypothetical protein [Candidatus Methanoperedens nitroreducens]
MIEMSRKYICSCGAPQILDKPLTLPRSENKIGLRHEFEEVFNVWKCEFCGKKENILIRATRQSRGINPPPKSIVNQYAPALVKIPKNHDHIRARTFIKILEKHFPERPSNEILEDMLLEGVIQVDYTMRNANRDSFTPMRVRLDPIFENEIQEILDKYRGIESVDEKVKRVKGILSTVDYEQINNPQSERILSILKIQENILLKGEIPYFDCGSKKCIVKKDNDRYEILLKILLALLESVRKEAITVSSDFYHSLNLDGTNISDYRSDIESILGAKLIFFGILRNIEPLYIPPSKIPTEVYTQIERFEIDLRSFIKLDLINYYSSIEVIVFKALKTIFYDNEWKQISKKMIKSLESDYDRSKNPIIKNAIDIATKSQQYDQFLFDRFFEAMVMKDLIKIIEQEWDIIFSKSFNYIHRDDILAKLKIIKEDRNIKSHPQSRIPTTFKTLTYIFELKDFIYMGAPTYNGKI